MTTTTTKGHRSARRYQEYVKRHERSIYNPSLHEICLTIAWATSYAMEERPLNENHPQWAKYFAYSEWFRHQVCAQLKLPLDTRWPKIYQLVGVLVEDEYPSREKYLEAIELGESQPLDDPLAPEMFDRFEEIKYQIVGRL